jgi:hypothetical protein
MRFGVPIYTALRIRTGFAQSARLMIERGI